MFKALSSAECLFNQKVILFQGYFRKGEVQLQCGQFETALLSYGKALQFQQNDMNIINAAKKTAHLSNEETMCMSHYHAHSVLRSHCNLVYQFSIYK